MATTENLYTGNGSTTDYSFTFPYLDTADIKTSLAGIASTAFTLLNATTVRFNSAPSNGTAIRIYRQTSDETLQATFYPGSAIRAEDLNENALQNLYVTQEANNAIATAWTTGDPTIVSTETWHTSDDTKVATTKAIENRIAAKIDTAMETDVLAGTDLAKTASGGQVTLNHNVSGANSTVNNNNGNVLQDITVTAQGHVTSVGSTNLDGRYYTETELDAGQLDNRYYTETELNAGQLDNRYYTETETGSLIDTKIDTALSNDVLAGQSITKSTSNGQVTISIANGAIDSDQLAADSVGASELANNSVASANIINGTIVDADIATGTLDNRYYTETELDAGQLDNRYYTETEVDANFYKLGSVGEITSGETWSAADNKVATTAAIDARITDLVDDVGGFVPIANETSFPAANPDVNNGAGTLVSIKALASNLTSNGSGVATISNGAGSGNTVTINGLANSTTYAATFGMIVETTSTLHTYTFHRLVPKATEVTTVSTNISNVNTVAGNNTNINTVAGANSNISTVATNISNVNNVGGSISNVNTVATNISNVNSFSDKYRVASSAPTSSLDTGDLYFDTSANELKVYNGSAWQGGVTATGNLAALGANTFTGNQSLGDDKKVIFGTGGDLEIYHDGSDSFLVNTTGSLVYRNTGDVYIQSDSTIRLTDVGNNETFLKCIDNGTVELYYDNSKKFETTSTGATISSSGDPVFTVTGSGHAQLNLTTTSGSDHCSINFGDSDDADAGEIRYTNSNNSLNFDTNGTGPRLTIDSSGHVLIPNDSGRIKLGTGSDLQIYHDGTNNYLVGSPPLFIRTNNLLIQNGAGTEGYISAVENGAVDLYYDNSKKLYTDANGVEIDGRLSVLDHFYLPDSKKIRLGNNPDLEIYHDGSTNIIDAATSNAISFRRGGSEQFFIGDSEFKGGDDKKIKLGTSDDLQIYHTGNHSEIADSGTGDLRILTSKLKVLNNPASADELMIQATENGAVELYYDNSKKLQTNSSGIQPFGNVDIQSAGHLLLEDDGKVQLGNSQDLQIYHDGNSYVTNTTANQLAVQSDDLKLRSYTDLENYLVATHNGAVELYWDGSKKFETNNVGAQWFGDLKGNDNQLLKLGTGNDLQIYHDGSDSYLKDVGTGNFRICSNNFKFNNAADNENLITAVENGAVNLHYDNSKKLETTASGVTVTGTVSDSKGNLRSIPQNSTTGTYTLVAADAGKHVLATGNTTIPASVFNTGDAITIINNSGSDISLIPASGQTVYNTADGNSSGNRTLAGRGMATVLYAGSNVYYISGAGLS